MSWSPKVRRGQEHPNASTEDAIADEILRDRQKGLTYDQLVEKYHVSRSTVQRILLYGAYRT